MTKSNMLSLLEGSKNRVLVSMLLNFHDRFKLSTLNILQDSSADSLLDSSKVIITICIIASNIFENYLMS